MWWNSMSTFQQTMFIIACAATLILIVQILLMLIGGSNDGDVAGGAFDGGVSDATDVTGGDFGGGIDGGDFSDSGVSSILDGDISDGAGGGDGDVTSGAHTPFGLRLLSLRSIIAFLSIGGWIGYTLCYTLDWYYAFIIALCCGFAAACAMAGAIIGMEKLQSNGNLNPLNAVGKIGTVYLTVPPERSGRGKINIYIQERYAEYEAVTDSNEPLPTASEIKVLDHIGANVLLVAKYKKPAITIDNEK